VEGGHLDEWIYGKYHLIVNLLRILSSVTVIVECGWAGDEV
jgi:hypothetical protein